MFDQNRPTDYKEPMSYENAPAARLVATDCCVCGRPLVDAVSVETGMGPHCRKKYGASDALSESDRKTANRLTYLIAAHTGTEHAAKVVDWLRILESMGLQKLVDAIEKKRVTIHIERDGDTRVLVKAPYHETADWHAIRGQRWNAARKVREVPATERASLYRVLMAYWPGAIGRGPKGLFVVGATV